MKEIDFSGTYLGRDGIEFDFGNTLHRRVSIYSINASYGHYKINEGYGTVAGFRIGNKVFYGISLCCPTDNFSRKIGRNNAKSNLISIDSSNKRGIMVIDDTTKDLHPTELFKLVLEHYLSRNKTRKPMWAKYPVVEFRAKAKKV